MRDTRDADPHHNPNRDLWQAVLARLVEDALIGPDTSAAKPQGRIKIIAEACTFLTQPSADLATLCHLAGLDPAAVMDRMRQRIASAASPEALVAQGTVASRPRKPKPAPVRKNEPFATKPVTIDGETRTILEWAERTGITIHTLRARLNNAWTLDKALTMRTDEARQRQRERQRKTTHHLQPRAAGLQQARASGKTWKRGSPERSLTHEGETLTIAEWAERIGVSAKTIKSRLNLGMSTADALTVGDLRRKRLDAQPDAPAPEGEGAARDFAPFRGTGDRAREQDMPKMDFQMETEECL